VVNLRDGTGASTEDPRQHVAGALAAFKVPTHIVFRGPVLLPRTTTGRVVKRDLRQDVAAGPAFRL
jgi:acyl-CoA synthetase (AMP-forming)/AMP-acid ligase II